MKTAGDEGNKRGSGVRCGAYWARNVWETRARRFRAVSHSAQNTVFGGNVSTMFLSRFPRFRRVSVSETFLIRETWPPRRFRAS
ncbi:hypothetical protein RJT34_12359 [Clitoria ternatea]|uniref:Uncharacterized protein n=1 Tax=Clitoria ternatea TaxID=43366 RepID=A0AAN9JQ60_CLITE